MRAVKFYVITTCDHVSPMHYNRSRVICFRKKRIHSHFIAIFPSISSNRIQIADIQLLIVRMSSPHTSDHIPNLKKSPKNSQKRSLGEKIMSLIFDGPSGTESSKTDRELRDKYEEDKLDDIPRTEKEERERQARIKKRAAMVGGGDGVRTNDMQKGGWGGAGLALGHA